jgi:hypothetical protein
MKPGDRVVVAGRYHGSLLWPYGENAWMVKFDTLQRFGYRQYSYDALTRASLIEKVDA